MVKNTPAMGKTWVRSLGWEDPLEEGMATHSSILAWRIPMDGGGLQFMGLQRLDMTDWLSTTRHITLKRSLMPFTAAIHF